MSKTNNLILFVAPFAGSALYPGSEKGCGGAERQLVLLAKGLADKGWEVVFLISPHPDKKELIDSRFRVIQVPFRYLGGSKKSLAPDICRLSRTLRDLGSPICVLRAGGPYVIGGLFLHRLFFGGKIVSWIQHDHDVMPSVLYPNETNFISRLPKSIYQRQIKYVDLIVAQTRKQQDAISRYLKRDSVVIPNVLGNLWSAEKKVLKKFDEGYFLWAGNPTENKRYELLYELARRMPEEKFVVAMNPGSKARFERARAEAKELGNVEFLGTVPFEEMEVLFDGASYVVNTSTAEGFPNTFLQAWSRGIPVISAGVDPDGIIDRFNTGLNVPVRHMEDKLVGEFCGRVVNYVKNAELRELQSSACVEYINKFHSADIVIDKLQNSLKALNQK